MDFKSIIESHKVLYDVKGVKKEWKELSMEERVEVQVELDNQIKGDLDKDDGIDCPNCLNRGFINVISDGCEAAKECECMKQRRTFIRLANSGISKENLETYTFKNYKATDNWQLQIKNQVIKYCKDISEGKRYWLCLNGITGLGKTHLCSAALIKFIKSNMTGYYLLWGEEFPRLSLLASSKFEDNQEKYRELINLYTSVDVLYIDDLFKNSLKKNETESLQLAYTIIDMRYRNRKITIISSEYDYMQMKALDSAVSGRIYEMANHGEYIISCGNDENKNYRLKGEN